MKEKVCKACGNSLKNIRFTYCDKCQYITYNCATCGKEKIVHRKFFYRKDTPDNSEKFCSTKCAIYKGSQIAAKLRENGSVVTCPNCGKEKYRSKADENRVFCNRKCYGEYRKKNPEKYPSVMNDPVIAKKARDTRISRGTNWMIGKKAELNHLWKGGKIHYRGPSWSDARKIVIARDGFLCKLCNRVGKDIHHIVPFRDFKYKPGKNRNDIYANHPDNLIYLCRNCHRTEENTGNKRIPSNMLICAINHYKSCINLLT